MRLPYLAVFGGLERSFAASIPEMKLYADAPQVDSLVDAVRNGDLWPVAVLGQVSADNLNETKERSDCILTVPISIWTRRESRGPCLELAERVRKLLVDGSEIDLAPDDFSATRFALLRSDSNVEIFDGTHRYQETLLTLAVRVRDLRVYNSRL